MPPHENALAASRLQTLVTAAMTSQKSASTLHRIRNRRDRTLIQIALAELVELPKVDEALQLFGNGRIGVDERHAVGKLTGA